MRIMRFSYVIGVLALLSLLASPISAMASSLLIWPIYPVIESDQQASALWLENQGSQPANMQLRIFAWSQERGDDQYQTQQSVVGSPPMMTIAPGERQMVRLIRQAVPPVGQEQAYRIIIDEIPALAPGNEVQNTPRAAVKLQMRYSLPLFVYGEGGIPPERVANHSNSGFYPGLSWRVIQQGEQAQLEIQNTGQHHVRLSQVAFKQGETRAEVSAGLLGYVLPGGTRRWLLPPGVRPMGELHAQILGESHRVLPK
ncbi:molecular chaperone [Halomonas sp. FME1]|uniref:Molecular chaperone n=2 Tax=Halomonadaceae TaxID=28256 RepID=A0ABR9EX83_9GAMM|nr:molecular chaperone [Halomonas casei]